ncbi:MAG TPA: STAS domain-containing protein [Ideonella sp.]|uniref:STAS domain-containing protein n=1 Tax=Ideonella sp. TaxID=1929293 RepID=UPI002B69D8CB|nr:STAS domain-containing protein [Ideonella sp.]HSI51581.1 STAS domain-containing protein [Ideonella sp.]
MASHNDPGPGGDGGMLRRMVKFVSAPAKDMLARSTEAGASQLADTEKAELKAMIERKRRNDFVRKRELDMLRRVRREGLTPEQAAALHASSRLDEADLKPSQAPGMGERDVTAKIDAIEKQMVGTAPMPLRSTPPRSANPPPLLTERLGDPSVTVPVALVTDHLADRFPATEAMPLGPMASPAEPVSPPPAAPRDLPPLAFEPSPQPAAAPRPVPPASRAAGPAAALARPGLPEPVSVGPAIEVNELPHDHELDEAVMAFANADFVHCERALVELTAEHGLKQNSGETWLVLFDLYRATGQQGRFESLAAAFSERFQLSAPQWYSLPRLVADATLSTVTHSRDAGDVGWVCPEYLDGDAVVQLNSQTMQLPLPWVLDWTLLQTVDADAALRLRLLLRQWGQQAMEMRWLAADRFFAALQEAAPVGVRDADPAFWLARLEALRLVNRPDQFDEVAIDYCVTYEVSPPSWEASRCVARIGLSGLNTRSATLSLLSEAVTSMHEGPDGLGTPVTTLELSGQLSGDIGPLLLSLDAKLGGTRVVRVSCALLIRVDFIAAGDLLNWVIAKRGQGREIGFTDVHRLVALMFAAMGVTEHASVRLRQA